MPNLKRKGKKKGGEKQTAPGPREDEKRKEGEEKSFSIYRPRHRGGEKGSTMWKR